MSKQPLCRLDELEPNTARRFDVDGRAIAVVRLGDTVYAIGDTCSHANISLSEGEIHDDEKSIECWKHGSEFSLETGEALTLPATRSVPAYEVVVDGDDVLVVLSEPPGERGPSGPAEGHERGARL
jgi:3-phenylpropionate/trans-cinnamate dioxygenase ferredoxin subunit